MIGIKSFVFTAAILFLSAADNKTQAQQSGNSALTAKEITDLINEYFKPPSEKREIEIIDQLSGQDKAKCTSALKTHIGKAETRERALNMAITLVVPGLFSTAQKFVDENETIEELITTLAFKTLDKGAEKFLVDRWIAKADDTTAHQNLTVAFENNDMSVEGLNCLKTYMVKADTNEERKEVVRQILNKQLGTDDFTAEKLAFDWKRLIVDFEKCGKQWPITGTDITTLTEYTADDGVTKTRSNVKIPAGKTIALSSWPDEFQGIGIEIKFRISTTAKDGAQFILKSQGPNAFQNIIVTLKSGKWCITDITGKEMVDGNGKAHSQNCKNGEWMEFKLVIAAKNAAETGAWGRVSLVLDGAAFVPDNIALKATNTLSSFTIKAGVEEALVGGFEIIKASK